MMKTILPTKYGLANVEIETRGRRIKATVSHKHEDGEYKWFAEQSYWNINDPYKSFWLTSSPNSRTWGTAGSHGTPFAQEVEEKVFEFMNGEMCAELRYRVRKNTLAHKISGRKNSIKNRIKKMNQIPLEIQNLEQQLRQLENEQQLMEMAQ